MLYCLASCFSAGCLVKHLIKMLKNTVFDRFRLVYLVPCFSLVVVFNRTIKSYNLFTVDFASLSTLT